MTPLSGGNLIDGPPLELHASGPAIVKRYRDVHPEPVYLCTVIKDLDENSQLYAKAS